MVQAGGMRCGGEKVRQKMSGGKAERSGRNDDGQEKACDKAGRNACCRIKAKGADRGEKEMTVRGEEGKDVTRAEEKRGESPAENGQGKRYRPV